MATATQNPNDVAENPWEMQVGASGGDYVLCPPGNYPAAIVGIFDVGHQKVMTKQRGEQEIRKIVLIYELAKLRDDGKPFVLGDRYTWSMHESSAFYALVSGLLGRKLREGEKFNPLSLLNAPCMVNVTNTAGEKPYHNISAVSQFPDGFPPPKAVHAPVSWSVMTGTPFPPGLDWLPYIYGTPVKTLAAESAEGRRLAAAPAGGDDSVPY